MQMALMLRFLRCSVALAAGIVLVSHAQAQAPLVIYSDSLLNGFQDWSWATRNLSNASPVHAGTRSISVTASAWQGLSFHHADLSATVYTNLSFWVHGGTGGGQRLQLYVDYGTNTGTAYQLPALSANTWRQYVVPLSSLGVPNVTNLNRLTWQLTASGTTGTFYLDDVQLDPKPAPLVHLNVDARLPLRGVDSRWFALNAAVWDSNFDTPTTVALLTEMGTRVLRFPGGSLSDEYHWASNRSGTNTWQWSTSFAKFVHVATNIGAQAFITVNYGSGTAAEAAGWVRHANVTNHLGFRYWEIGNENYGTWETDTNSRPHDAYTYATRARDYYVAMKASDPSIKIGVVVIPGEESSANGYSDHPAYNPRTGQTHFGWTPVLLTTLKTLGVTPDFLVHHRYPQWTDSANPVGSDNDAYLLQCSTAWAADAADLRQQVTDYFGPGGSAIELVCTENNSDSGAQGRQSTSLVNGLYYADSLAQLMKTEFNAFVWWDLRNGTDTSGCFDNDVYGWRTYGDLGLVNGLNTRHPTFYATKLMQCFAQPGDSVLGATSDYLLLSAYAARLASGAVSLMILHKDPTTNFTAQISLTGFVPDTTATVRSFGIPQDEAARTNAALALQDIATNTISGAGAAFNLSFPPLSMTLLTLTPPPPQLNALAPDQPGGPLTLELRGQPSVRYLVENSTNLTTWTSVTTNTLLEPTLYLTSSVPPGLTKQFWRAVWRP
jgi:alpha-L-arabinofuranosidase